MLCMIPWSNPPVPEELAPDCWKEVNSIAKAVPSGLYTNAYVCLGILSENSSNLLHKQTEELPANSEESVNMP